MITIGPRETLPRVGSVPLDSGDWSVTRPLLAKRVAKDGTVLATLFHWRGHMSWKCRGEYGYFRGRLVMTNRAWGRSWRDLAEGERLCVATLRAHAAEIDEVFGAGVANQLHPQRTLTVTED